MRAEKQKPVANRSTDDSQEPKKGSNKRRELIELSAVLIFEKGIKRQGMNQALKQFYCEQAKVTDLEFNSYKQWLELGFQVRKGEKAYLFWSKPRFLIKDAQTDNLREIYENERQELDEAFKFFNVAFLFSNLQVDKKPLIKS